MSRAFCSFTRKCFELSRVRITLSFGAIFQFFGWPKQTSSGTEFQ